MNEKKRSWQSLAKENEALDSLLIHTLLHCPICKGSRQSAREGVIFDCWYCGSLWFRYTNITGKKIPPKN